MIFHVIFIGYSFNAGGVCTHFCGVFGARVFPITQTSRAHTHRTLDQLFRCAFSMSVDFVW